MEQTITNRLIYSVFRFKQIEMAFRFFRPGGTSPEFSGSPASISITELAVLKGIKDRTFESGEITIPDLLCISRAAVSQMLGVLEQKGYIIRDINKKNRRKQLLSLTEKGEAAVKEQEQKILELFEEIITQFGENKMERFIKLFSGFMDTIEKVKTGMNYS
jgi:DNA-binding MarR family transcriptional regulator